MNEVRRGTTLAAGALPVLAAVLLVAAFAIGKGARHTDAQRQELVRLTEALADPGAAPIFERRPLESAAGRESLIRDSFPRNLDEWIFLPGRGDRLVAEGHSPTEAGVRLSGARGRGSLIFTSGQGILVKTIEVDPDRPYSLRAEVRVKSTAAAEAPDKPSRTFLTAAPIRHPLDLAQALADASLQEIWASDRGRELLCYGKPPPTFSAGPVPATGEWLDLRVEFRSPTDARVLVLEFFSGDDQDFEVELRGVELRAVKLRDVLEREAERAPGGSAVPAGPSLQLGGFGLEPLTAAPDRPLYRIDCLGERRDGILLPPPADLSFETTLPAGDLVLEYGRTRLFEHQSVDAAHPIKLRVAVRSVESEAYTILHDEELPGDEPPGWLDLAHDVSYWAGKRVRFHFSTDAIRATDVLALGAPVVRRRAPLDPRPNIVVVSLDTVRADHLGIGGYARPTTPFLDALARRSLWFENAYSSSSFTLPAHATLFTGQLPSLHGALASSRGRNRLEPARSDLLGVRLRDAGYLTVAFTGGAYVGPQFGFAEGFDRYSGVDPLLPDRAPLWDRFPVPARREFNLGLRDGRRFDAVLDWVRTHRDSRFVLFLHTFLVHEYLPSAAPPEGLADPDEERLDRFLATLRDKTRDAGKLDPRDLAAGIAAYDATLREADTALRELVEHLQRLRLWERTLFIVTSDHGEEFLEDGRLGHGRTLHQEMIRVPLLIHLPGRAVPRSIEANVSLADLLPTILDLVDLEPGSEMHGRSLLPLANPAHPVDAAAAVFAELDVTRDNGWSAAVKGPFKLVERRDETAGGGPGSWIELYDLGNDPAEEQDLEGERPREARSLHQLLRTTIDRAAALRAAQSGSDEGQALDPDLRAVLEELGYLVDEQSP